MTFGALVDTTLGVSGVRSDPILPRGAGDSDPDLSTRDEIE